MSSKPSPITASIPRVLLDENRDRFLDHYGMRNRDCYRFWYRDSYRLRDMDRNRVRNWDFDWNLNRVRDRLLDSIRHPFLDVDRVRFRDMNRVGFINRDSHRDLHGVGDLLLDMNWVGLGEWNRDFLRHCDGLHVLNLVTHFKAASTTAETNIMAEDSSANASAVTAVKATPKVDSMTACIAAPKIKEPSLALLFLRRLDLL
jgi:hypothetical protein